MADFMRTWVHLPPKTRDMVANVLVDGSASWASIARNMKVSRQAVHQNLIKAAKNHSEIRAVLRRRFRLARNHA